jgi:carbonic anhydrase
MYEYNNNFAFFYEADNSVDLVVKDVGDTFKVTMPTPHNILARWDTNNVFHAMDMLQFHFHSPSDHTFSGEHYDLELHIVSQDFKDPLLSVTAIFFDTVKGGTQNNDFLDKWLLTGTAKTKNIPKLDLETLLDNLSRAELYSYQGSLTSPPCSETVTWIITTQVLNISPSQL